MNQPNGAPDFLVNLLHALFGPNVGQMGRHYPGGSPGFNEQGPQMGGGMPGLVTAPSAPPPIGMGDMGGGINGAPPAPPPIGMDGGMPMDRTGGNPHAGSPSPYGGFHRRMPKVEY